jgi:predicted phosphodiesterase
VRTALLSDLHLGSLPGSDLARDPEIRARLLGELEGADRVVLLGDTFELRDRPLAEVMGLAMPFFEELDEALGDASLVLVPGNHDHRLAEPLLERRALGRSRGLGLEQSFKPGAGLGASVARRLSRVNLSLAYPGIWVREDVYATHGHYLDCHLTVPRIECLLVAAAERVVGPVSEAAVPEDYERVLAPLYGLAYGFAQAGGPARLGAGTAPSLRFWARVNGGRARGRIRTRLLGSVVFPLAVGAARRGLRRPFERDVSPPAIARAGLTAMSEVARRLRIEARHVIYGHTHHPGPREGHPGWELRDGLALHNCGCWIYARGLSGPGAEGGLFWPGSVIWVEDEGPPRRSEVLEGVAEEELLGAARRIRAVQREAAPARG